MHRNLIVTKTILLITKEALGNVPFSLENRGTLKKNKKPEVRNIEQDRFTVKEDNTINI